MKLAELAMRLHNDGQDVTLDALGGCEAVTHALATETGPGADLLIRALVANWEQADSAAAASALQTRLAAEQDPIAYEELWNALFERSDVFQAIAATVAAEPARRLECSSNDREAGLASSALDALCRMSLTLGVAPWKLYGALDEMKAEAATHLLVAAIRRVGLIYVHDDSLQARELVRRFLGRMSSNHEVAADARFELARADLVDALASTSREAVDRLLRRARGGFGEALALDAERVDAELYGVALDAVLGLIDRRPHGELKACAEQVRSLGFLRRAWNAPGRTEWFGDPLAADREWWFLSQALARASQVLTDHVWLEPMVVLEQLARAVRAVTTARPLSHREPTGALSMLVIPEIRAPFVADASKRALVRKWVSELSGEDRATGDLLVQSIEDVDPKAAADQLRAELIREVGESIVDDLSPANQLALVRRLDARKNVLLTEKPQVRRAFDAAVRQLQDNRDYTGEVRACFDGVLLSTLRFLADRMNVLLSDPRFAYLKDPNALEAALQEDYRQWVVGNGLQGVVDVEVSHVAAGRVDVRFAFGTHILVTEVKRDSDPFEAGTLARYLNQAGAYQASNVRLGILLVLDLSDKARGETRSLENSVWVTTKPALAQGDLARHIVVVVVPGNRALRPSEVRA